MELNEINTEIARLQAERCKLLNENKFAEESFIKSLEWTKECIGKLEINGFSAIGIPSYNINLYGECPHCIQAIQIMGSHKFYQYNIMYGKNFLADVYSFYTSSDIILIEFLNKAIFKELKYDEAHWRILDTAKRISELTR